MDALDIAATAALQQQGNTAVPATPPNINALFDKYVANPASLYSPSTGGDALDAAAAAYRNGSGPNLPLPPGAKTRQEYMASEGGISDSPSYDQYVATKRAALAEQQAIDNESVGDKVVGALGALYHGALSTAFAPVQAVTDLVHADGATKFIDDQVNNAAPLNQAGQRYLGNVGNFIDASGINGIAPLAELSVASHLPVSGQLSKPPVLAAASLPTLAEQSSADAAANVRNLIGGIKDDSIVPAPNVWSKGAPDLTPVFAPASDAITPSQLKAVLPALYDEQPALTPSQLKTSAAPVVADDVPQTYPFGSGVEHNAEYVPDWTVPEAAQDAAQLMPASSLDRLNEARSLPVPIDLTLGQATGEVHQLSFEQNNRGAIPALADRFNQQNYGLLRNLDAIRENVAPDINTAPGVATDQALVDAIKGIDTPKRADISAKYQALKDANGGNFPVRGQDFVNSADAALKADNVTRFVPPEVKGLLDDLRDGGNMNYNDFENYRTILGQQARKFIRSGDGTAEHAVNLVRNSLESIPMSNETAAIKPLADAARQAAADRFKIIESDPAYKAAINDDVKIGEPSPVADNFMQKYVVNGKTSNVKNLINNLKDDPKAQQLMAAGVVDHLKQAAGIDLRTNTGNISQAGLNRAIASLDQKKLVVMDPRSVATIDSIGNVARYTQQQPRGSYVNNSNTLVGSLVGKAKKGVEMAGNAVVPGLGLGTEAAKFLERKGQAKIASKALNPELASAPREGKIQALKNEGGYVKDAVIAGAKSLTSGAKALASVDPRPEAEAITNAARNSVHLVPTLTLAEQQAANIQRLRDAEAKAAAQRALARKILPALR